MHWAGDGLEREKGLGREMGRGVGWVGIGGWVWEWRWVGEGEGLASEMDWAGR